MIFEEEGLKIIARNFNWSEEETNTFIGMHFKTIMDFANKTAFAYLAENEPERMDEINELAESDDEKDKAKSFKVINDQINLLITSYPDLRDHLNAVIRDYEINMLFEFLAEGPVEGALELIKYLNDKIKKLDFYLKVLKTVQDRAGKSKVDEVLAEA